MSHTDTHRNPNENQKPYEKLRKPIEKPFQSNLLTANSPDLGDDADVDEGQLKAFCLAFLALGCRKASRGGLLTLFWWLSWGELFGSQTFGGCHWKLLPKSHNQSTFLVVIVRFADCLVTFAWLRNIGKKLEKKKTQSS